MLIPRVGAFLLEPFDDVAERGVIFKALSAAIAEKHDDRHAPETLARDAPIGALLNHFVNALFAPAGNPFHVGDFGERFGTQRFFAVGWNCIHANKPLHCRAKDHWVMAAPAMRVAVLVSVVTKQRPAIGEQLYDDRIGGEDVLAFVFGQPFGVNALVVERRVNFQSVSLAGIEVIHAMTGRGMNDATTLIKSDVIGKQAGHLNRQKWMPEQHAFEVAALVCRENFGFLDFALGLKRGNTINSKKKLAFFGLHDSVLIIRMKRQP